MLDIKTNLTDIINSMSGNFYFNIVFLGLLGIMSLVILGYTVAIVVMWYKSRILRKQNTELDKQTKELEILIKQFETSSFKSDVGKSVDITINRKAYRLIHDKVRELQISVDKELVEIELVEIEREEVIKERQESAKSLALTSLIVKHTSKSNTIAYLFSIASLISYIFLVYLGVLEKGFLIPCLSIVFIIIIFTKQQILVHRIKTGQYGSNEYEAREIISFILDEANKHYFNGGNGHPVIFSNENLEEIQQSVKDFIDGGIRV